MKSVKKLSTLLLALVMLLTMSFPTLAVSEKDWEKEWSSADAQAGIVMFVGSNESQRNFSWYSKAKSSPKVIISTSEALENAHTFVGSSVRAVEGGVVNKVTDLNA